MNGCCTLDFLHLSATTLRTKEQQSWREMFLRVDSTYLDLYFCFSIRKKKKNRKKLKAKQKALTASKIQALFSLKTKQNHDLNS